MGRTLRLVIGLVLLILMIPLLMFKLESANRQSYSENVGIESLEVNLKRLYYLLFRRFYLLFRRKRLILLLGKMENLWDYR